MNLNSIFDFVWERSSELWLRTGEHLMLTGVSTGMAILIGIPAGIYAARYAWLRGPLLAGIGVLQTVPSLAMLAILLALLQKIGAVPAIIALTLYALLPIVRNTVTGLDGVSSDVIEAARGIGMTSLQRLWIVEFPLAAPVIIAGIRTAAVVGVGIATLSAFIGAGGLGQFINRGLALSNTNLILLGAIPAALLALIVDGCIAAFQWGIQRQHQNGSAGRARFLRYVRPVALLMPLMLVTGGAFAYVAGGVSSPNSNESPVKEAGKVIRIGSKDFTEQLILGELMAQIIEARTSLEVERRFNLGGTMICHGALESGAIDLYAEYTGTALTAILKQPVIADPVQALQAVGLEYARRFEAEWLSPFGFNNTYAITVRRSDASARQLQNISDLAAISSTLRAGFTAEFAERPDGFPGLRDVYGLEFVRVQDLNPAIMYEAIAQEEVDVICAFATDGRIAAFDLQPLEDDKGFFPPYQAAPVVRAEVLNAHPKVRDALGLLAGMLDDNTMQRLNLEVDDHKKSPRVVALDFLETQGIL